MAPARSSDEIQAAWTPSPFFWTALSIMVLMVLIVFFGSWFTVGAGEVGVVFNSLNGKTSSATQGFHGKVPLVESVTTFSVKTRKTEMAADSASRDLQKVSVHVALNYHLVYEKVDQLYVRVGKDYENIVIAPAVAESVKASTAQFPVEQIIVQREKLKDMIETALKTRLIAYDIILESVNLINIDFDPDFNKVVEQKQMEEQKVKTAEFLRQQAEKNRATEILKAQAEGEKQRLLKISVNADVVALKWIEAWKAGGSQVPSIIMGGSSGGNMFMLDVNKLPKVKKGKAEAEADAEAKE